jgi:hypothetical protein
MRNIARSSEIISRAVRHRRDPRQGVANMYPLVDVDDEQAEVPRVTRMMGDITITPNSLLCDDNDATPESLPSLGFSARWSSPTSQRSPTQTKSRRETFYNTPRRRHCSERR